jgi:signal transduction histidine kinase
MLVLRARGGDLRALDDYRQHIDTGIVGWAGRNRQRALVNDVARDPRFVPVPGIDTITSELALPLVAGDRVLGVLDIESDRPIGEDDAAAFEIVADQLGVAIANAELFATVEGMLDQTRLLYETSQRISTAMTVEEVVAAYLEQVALRGRYACTVVLYEFDAAGERIAVDLCGRWLPGHQGIDFTPERIPYTVRLLDPALDAGETVRISDVFTDPRASQTLREIQRASGRPALAFIPLIARGTRIGAVILSYPSVHSWPEAELRPYEITAAQLATALDTRMQQQLFYERGRQLAVVAERQRIARELHDSITQNLFSMTLAAQTISTAFERDAAEGNQRVGRLLELGQQALVEMRALLAELHPLESPSTPESTGGAVPTIYLVRRQGLVTALRTHVAGLTDDSVAVTLDSEGYISQPEEWEEPLFRIAQEALNNVAKHARARHVTIRLTTSEGQTYLAVTDDGVGFSSGPAPAGAAIGQLGLTSMRERAASLGARLDVRSAPGAGTTVEVILPAVKASRV